MNDPAANPRPHPEREAVPRLALRLDDVAKALGLSRRTLERERSAGRLPSPDLTIGRMPLWRLQTISRWLDGQADGRAVNR